MKSNSPGPADVVELGSGSMLSVPKLNAMELDQPAISERKRVEPGCI